MNIIMGANFNLPNIDWPSMTTEASCKHSDALIDVAFAYNLTQIVSSLTRITESASSILDLVLVSQNLYVADDHCVVTEGLPDHHMVVLDCPELVPKCCPDKKLEFKDYNRAQDESIIDCLQLSFDRFADRAPVPGYDVDELWCTFQNAVHTCIGRFVPSPKK